MATVEPPQPPRLHRSATKKNVLDVVNEFKVLRHVPGRRTVFQALVIVSFVSVFYSLIWTFVKSTPSLKWLYAGVNASSVIGGAVVFGKHAIPHKTFNLIQKVICVAFFLLEFICVAYLNDRLKINGTSLNNEVATSCFLSVAVLQLYFFFLHVFYGGGGTSSVLDSPPPPPTYAKYVVPSILFASLAYSVLPSIPAYEFLAPILLPLLHTHVLVSTIFLIYGDKPIDKSKREVVVDGVTLDYYISGDGYYFAGFFWLMISLSTFLAVGQLVTTVSFPNDPLASTVVTQILSFLLLAGSRNFSLRCSDENRFALLMLVVFFEIHFFQSMFFLQVDMFSPDFWKMVLVTEIGSMSRNSGFTSTFLYVVRINKKLPYADSRQMKILKSVSLVETLCEMLVGCAALSLYAVEKEARTWSGATTYKVEGPGEAEFEFKACLSTVSAGTAMFGVSLPYKISLWYWVHRA